jgi:hypothetical protein
MSLLSTIQSSVDSLLTADSFFTPNPEDTDTPPIPIITEAIGDITNEIDKALGKLGLCAIVLTPSALAPLAGAKMFFEDISITVTVIENVLLKNSSLPTAAETAEAVAYCLHLARWQDSLTAKYNAIVCQGIELTPQPDEGLLAYNIKFKTKGGLSAAPTRPTET